MCLRQYPLADFLPFTESPPSSPGSKVRGIFLRRYNRAVTATPAFKDHFSLQSEAYRRFRPEYPATLFEWLTAQAPGRKLAIDVATGNGQAAVALASLQVFEDEEQRLLPTRLEPQLRQQRHDTSFAGL